MAPSRAPRGSTAVHFHLLPTDDEDEPARRLLRVDRRRREVTVAVRDPNRHSATEALHQLGSVEALMRHLRERERLSDDAETTTEATFRFPNGHVFVDATAEDVYDKAIRSAVAAALGDGVNATVVAFGGARCGKSGLLVGDLRARGEWGAIPRALEEVFDALDEPRGGSCPASVHVTYVRVHHESVTDLLRAGAVNGGVSIREEDASDAACGAGAGNLRGRHARRVKEVYLQGATHARVADLEAAFGLVVAAEEERARTETTASNDGATSVFTIHVDRASAGGGVVSSKVNFVDCAAAERSFRAGVPTGVPSSPSASGIVPPRVAASAPLAGTAPELDRLLSLLSSRSPALAMETGGARCALTRLLRDATGPDAATVVLAACRAEHERHVEQTARTCAALRRIVNAGLAAAANHDAAKDEIATRGDTPSTASARRAQSARDAGGRTPGGSRASHRAMITSPPPPSPPPSTSEFSDFVTQAEALIRASNGGSAARTTPKSRARSATPSRGTRSHAREETTRLEKPEPPGLGSPHPTTPAPTRSTVPSMPRLGSAHKTPSSSASDSRTRSRSAVSASRLGFGSSTRKPWDTASPGGVPSPSPTTPGTGGRRGWGVGRAASGSPLPSLSGRGGESSSPGAAADAAAERREKRLAAREAVRAQIHSRGDASPRRAAWLAEKAQRASRAATAAARKTRAELEWIEAARLRQKAREKEHESLLRTRQRSIGEVKAQSWAKAHELEAAMVETDAASRKVLESDRPPLEALASLSLEDRVKFGVEAARRVAQQPSKPLPRHAKLDDYLKPKTVPRHETGDVAGADETKASAGRDVVRAMITV